MAKGKTHTSGRIVKGAAVLQNSLGLSPSSIPCYCRTHLTTPPMELNAGVQTNLHENINGSTVHSSQRWERTARVHRQRDAKQNDVYLDWGSNSVIRDKCHTACVENHYIGKKHPVSRHCPGASSYGQCPEKANLEGGMGS